MLKIGIEGGRRVSVYRRGLAVLFFGVQTGGSEKIEFATCPFEIHGRMKVILLFSFPLHVKLQQSLHFPVRSSRPVNTMSHVSIWNQGSALPFHKAFLTVLSSPNIYVCNLVPQAH